MRITILCLLLTLTLSAECRYAEADTSLILMGTRFKFKSISTSKDSALISIKKGIEEVKRIENLISSHKETSETYKVNANCGKHPVKVNPELFSLIMRCQQISRITDGAFDISFAPLYKVWKFDGSMTDIPDSADIKLQLDLVGYNKIELDSSKKEVFLPYDGMAIGFGAIGKGYAANMAKKAMMKAGATSGFVDASGDILFWGNNANDDPWKVAIASPSKKGEMLGNLLVNNLAVVTSGNYEKNFRMNGALYSHIIDPKTGFPVEEAISVTIVGPDAEIADALATAVSVLGVRNGLKLINQIRYFEALIIDESLSIHKSNNFKIHFI